MSARILLALLVCLSSITANAKTLFFEDFEDAPLGKYSKPELARAFPNPKWDMGIDQGCVDIVKALDGKAMRINNNSGAPYCLNGAMWRKPIPGKVREFYLSFDVKWDWEPCGGNRQGKFMGVCGGNCPSGNMDPSGGWMVRTHSGSANCHSYVHWDGIEHTLGYHWTNGWRKGTRYHTVQYIKLNDPAKSDGELKVWLNGNLVRSQSNIKYQKQAYDLEWLMIEANITGPGKGLIGAGPNYSYWDNIRLYTNPADDKDSHPPIEVAPSIPSGVAIQKQ